MTPAPEPRPGSPGLPGGRLYLGWLFATPLEDPGAPPARPAPAEKPRLSADWVAAQRREESLLNRPPKVIAAVGVALTLGLTACTMAGRVPVAVAVPAIVACLLAAATSGWTMWRAERALRGAVASELARVERFRADQERVSRTRQAEYAASAAAWRLRKTAFERQKRWYCLSLPDGIDRVDVAGGTLAGWSALLTMAGAHRLARGGEVTVIDLSGGAVAADLAGLADRPAVWVLPDDLPRLDIAASLTGAELAEVLALTVSLAEERGSPRDLAIDSAILDRVIGVLDGSGASEAGPAMIGCVAAALRTLAHIGDPRAEVAAGLLTDREIGAVTALFGSGATDRVVLDRALGLEAQLRVLAGTGSVRTGGPGAGQFGTRLRVVAVDRGASPQAARLLGGFAVAALTQLIGRRSAGDGEGISEHSPWEHTIFLLGADRLRDDVLDRLTDVCESSRTGLVLGYRSMPPPVRQRIGRGNAAVAFMRLGNAEDAKAASEQLGTEHRFVVSQLTETIGTSVTDTAGTSYTSTFGESSSVAVSTAQSESVSQGTGRSRSAGSGVLPLGEANGSSSAQHGTSSGTTESASLTAGISTSTAWGESTSRATGDSESLARSLQRSREFVVEASELQRLPVTAMIVSYAGPTGRHVLFADANPAIGDLPMATMNPLPEAADAAEAVAVRDAPFSG